MTNNVVLFPKAKRGTPPQTLEELIENVSEARKEHIEFVIDESLAYVFGRCYEEGFDLNQDHCLKTTALIVEALRAGLYMTVHLDHPLHAPAESMFVMENELPLSQEETIVEESEK